MRRMEERERGREGKKEGKRRMTPERRLGKNGTAAHDRGRPQQGIVNKQGPPVLQPYRVEQ